VSEYLRARSAFSDWTRLSATERESRLRDALTQLVRRAAAVPYYRELFRTLSVDADKPVDFAQWRELPPLDKDVLRERAEDLLSASGKRAWLQKEATGGSTGVPVKFQLGPIQQGWRWATHEHLFGFAGFRPGDRAGYLWGAALDPGTGDSLGTKVTNLLVNQRIHNCFRLDDALFEQLHRDLERYKPRFLVGYACALALFARFIERRGLRPGYPEVAIITGAEKLEPQARRALETVFGVPAYETYGSRDCGGMAAQSHPGGPFEIALPYVLLEPYGEPADDGSQEVLVTHLRPSDGTVMIRYRVGDRARFEDERPFPTRLIEVTGRALDHLRLPSGRVVHSIQFPHLFKDYDVVEYQVLQSSEGDVAISLVPGTTLDDEQQKALGERLSNMIAEVPVRLVVVRAIDRGPSGKRRPVISHYQAPPRAAVDPSPSQGR
jgi:phenylacetate-CoA ligase